MTPLPHRASWANRAVQEVAIRSWTVPTAKGRLLFMVHHPVMIDTALTMPQGATSAHCCFPVYRHDEKVICFKVHQYHRICQWMNVENTV